MIGQTSSTGIRGFKGRNLYLHTLRRVINIIGYIVRQSSPLAIPLKYPDLRVIGTKTLSETTLPASTHFRET